jgi:mono/diheme cytochrome c family protein
LKSPEAAPPGPQNPGTLEADLASLDGRGGKTFEPTSLPPDRRAALDQFLRESFGTPSAPTLNLTGDPDVESATVQAGLSAETLAEGGKLFRRHCQSCHGLTGDSRGPAGLFINPYPRDFRRGAFKFVTTGEGAKPRRVDILRLLADGIKGTAMPAFALLPVPDRELLARYVLYLSVRGQVEFESLQSQTAGGAGSDVSAVARERLKVVLAEWLKAEKAGALPAPPEDGEPVSETHQAAVRRGYALFTAKTGTECLKCHGDFGRQPLLRYDLWGTVARPANFTTPDLKGGTRPEDVYARVRFGIAPVGMPAHPTLTDRQVWDLVRFVRAAPYPVQLPADIRDAVYGNR